MQFADCVRSIAATRLDAVGLGDFPACLAEQLSGFDEVVSWYGSNRPEFREAMSGVHPRCTFHTALPGKDCSIHASDFFLRQVGAPDGLIPRISVSASGYRGTLVIHPFSGSAGKNWPLDRYQEFAARSPLAVEWIAGPEELLAGATRFESLLDLALWMTGAAAYMGNDSGISHLAAAVGLPSVVLFGPTNPVVWAPRGGNVRVVQWDLISELSVDAVAGLVTATKARY